jgi:SAM-dependent methyltransferase
MERNVTNLQEGYDRVAAAYAAALFRELESKPFDRQVLDSFITEVKDRGPACDMGCGPGQVARYLYDHGLRPVLGVDLSPEMVRQARMLSPEIPFEQGDMLKLEALDQAWAGIAAFYAIIHFPRQQVVDVLRELRRVLIPGGLLLLSIHIDVGEGVTHIEEFFGQPVSLDFVFFEPEEIEAYLQQAGFERIEVYRREPYPEVEYQGPRAYIFARTPSA